ncbi:hypothetical protein C7H75_24975 (plasmid) [Prescottella equi]|nr:hypothetical protein C7H75_24975 [Prescottella equi]
MSDFVAYLDPQPEVSWTDDSLDILDSACAVARIRVVQESTGEEVGNADHTDVLGWHPDSCDNALAAAGWKRIGDWRHRLFCAVEPA